MNKEEYDALLENSTVRKIIEKEMDNVLSQYKIRLITLEYFSNLLNDPAFSIYDSYHINNCRKQKLVIQAEYIKGVISQTEILFKDKEISDTELIHKLSEILCI